MTEKNQTSENNEIPRKTIRILLADDHKILRSGIRRLLENEPNVQVIAEAEDGRTAVKLSHDLAPDAILMDISMNGMNGIEATRQIIGHSPKTKVIILSMHSGQKLVADVFKAGASAYLLKDCDFSEIMAAIAAVTSGKAYLCPQIATVIRNDYLQNIPDRNFVRFRAIPQRARSAAADG